MEERNGYIFVPWQEWLHNSSGVVNPRWGIPTPVEYLVKHHTPDVNPGTLAAAITALNGIWRYHTYSAEGGWGWIGYNTTQWARYIFEGAGIGNRGIHAPGANGISHGHAFLLDSRLRQPTQEEWSALRAFCGDLVSWGKMNSEVLVPNSGYNTVHHDWVSTACAGPGVDESAHRFYISSPNPNPDPNPKPERRKGGENVMFLPRIGTNGKPFVWPPGSFGFEGGCVAFDAAVPAGYKLAIAPSQQQYREINVSLIVNGNAQKPAAASESKPHFYEVTSDSFITVLVSADVVPNISVG